jgi:hypothetical protein
MVTKLVALLALSAGGLCAQGGRGTITGAVKDGTGAVIPGVSVGVLNEKTGAVMVVKSQANGAYLAPQLQPGDYTVSAEQAGFKRLEISGLKVDVDSTLTQDLVLEVGAVSEKLQVSGQASLVETTSGQVGTTVQISHVQEMPLVDRNVFSLVNLVPGASFSASRVSLAGGRTMSTAALLDGVNNTRGGLGDQNVEMSPPVDSMQEFKVEVNAVGAEFGRSSAGIINAVTRGGTNALHGSLYEFLRNDKLDAAGWNADRKPPLRRNNYGVTVGGPVIRNRTFFFYNLDGLRQGVGATTTRNVGLPAWRNGDFSSANRDAGGRAAQVVIYDPETGSGTFANPLATTPFPNNVIPTARLDPVALKILGYMPNPNRPPDNPFNQAGNWQQNAVNTTTRDYHTIRVDHQVTSTTRLFVRWILTQPESARSGYAGDFGPADPDGVTTDTRHQNAVLNATHLFSPTFFLNFTTGFNRIFQWIRAGDCCDTNYGKLLGLANVPGEVFPSIGIAGGLVPVTNLAQGAAGTASGTRHYSFTNTDWVANFTKISGNHTLKFGGQYTRFNGNDLTRTTPSGSWGFDGRYTRGINSNGSVVANTGIVLADFLLGRLISAGASVSSGIGKRSQYYAGYLQDDWRVTRNLTLNLGLRWEAETPPSEVANRMSNFDPYQPNPLAGTGDIPAGALGIMTFAGRLGKGAHLWGWDKTNFAPRFGFAWRVLGTNDTVVRGGFGIFFGAPYDMNVIQMDKDGFANNYSVQAPVPFRLRDGLPPTALDDAPASELVPTYGSRGTRFMTSSLNSIDPQRATQYSENFNLTIQHQWRGVLVEIGYLANLSRHIPLPIYNMNQIPPELLSRTDILARLRRPITVLGSDQPTLQMISRNVGLSSYHGFTFKSERRFRQGIGWLVSYAFTRWIDNVGFQGAGNFGDNDAAQNIYNMRAERSLSTNCTPHRLVFSPIVEMPFGKGKPWLNRGGWLNQLVGGWELSTLGTIRSGAPFGVTVLNGARDILGDPATGRVLRANLVGDLTAGDNQGKPAVGVRGIQWLNPAAFAVPAQFTLGNEARTMPKVLGPGSINFDSMVGKNFSITERWRAQFRWELFNTFNTPQFGLPNQDLGGGSFGTVTGAGGRRIMQFGLKLYW